MPGDYDGDGKADVATYDPVLGRISARPSGGGPTITKDFGVVQGDAAVGKRPNPAGYPY